MSLKNYDPKTLSSLNELLVEIFGEFASLDLTTMFFLFWIIVALIILAAVNLYLKVIGRTKQISDDEQKNNIQQEELTNVIPSANDIQKQKSDDSSEKPTIGSNKNQFINWINDAIQWFLQTSTSNESFSSDLTKCWLNALNAKSKKLIIENGIFVEFISLEQCIGPKLSRVDVAEEINENIIMTMKINCDRLVIQVRVAPDTNVDASRSALYDVYLEKFSSLIKAICITDESLFVIRFVERPETKAQIEGPILGSKNKFIQDVIINAILNVFTSTIFDINFGKFHDFPKVSVEHSQKKMKESTNNLTKSNIERKLLLKIVKAYELDLSQSESHQIYCTIEIDEPFQSTKTSLVRENIESPVWDQHFMFNLNERSHEILFELFDTQRNNKKDSSENDIILGNAIVNISELISNPSQIQNLRLQSGMNKKDFGYLTVEFLLMEHNTSSLQSLISSNELGNVLQNNQNFIEDSSQSLWSTSSELSGSNFDDYCDVEKNYDLSFVDLENWEHISKTSSLLTTLGRDIPNIELMLLCNTDNDHDNDISQNSRLIHSKSNQQSTKLGFQDESNVITKENGHALGSLDNDNNNQSSHLINVVDDKHTSFEKGLSDPETLPQPKNSKSLIRNLKKRFSFNKRSKSVDRQISTRSSVSIGNDNSDIELERARSVPGSREPSMPKEIIAGKKQESFGNLSQTSTRTFLHEDSVLILECSEKNTTKYYVVPNVSAKKNKWRKKGNKLHLYKDHLFAACHIPSSRLCQVCCKKFSFRLGKQAYQCRNCTLYCHKPCHVNVVNRCFSSNIAALNLELLELSDEQQQQQQRSASQSHINNTIPELKVTDVEELNAIR